MPAAHGGVHHENDGIARIGGAGQATLVVVEGRGYGQLGALRNGKGVGGGSGIEGGRLGGLGQVR